MSKYIVELWLDGYETDDDREAAEKDFIEEQLDFSGSSVKVEKYKRNPNAIEVDYYEGANLLWLLNLASRLHLDAGDWCGQLRHKLEARADIMAAKPNADEQDTASRLHSTAFELIGLGGIDYCALKRQREILYADPLTDRAVIKALDKILGAKPT